MMRIHFSSAAAGLAALVAATGAAMSANTDTIATAKGPIEILAIHHASLMLTWNGKHVLVDPAPLDHSGTPDTSFARLPKPDVIFYTHDHFDHFNPGILEAEAGPDTQIYAPQEVADLVPKPLQSKVHVLANGDKTAVDGIGVEAVPMYNTSPERTKFHPKGKGNGYILTFGDRRIYVAGDTEEAPELAHLPRIDAAFLPMNLPYTETVEAAAHWVKDFKPRIVYPYHFRNGDGSKSDLNAFKADVGGASDVRVLDWY
jgi:L-ascorbate metabolism protein UlaG (beta-lactamase superfamily)